jgi:hypothetical protein
MIITLNEIKSALCRLAAHDVEGYPVLHRFCNRQNDCSTCLLKPDGLAANSIASLDQKFLLKNIANDTSKEIEI